MVTIVPSCHLLVVVLKAALAIEGAEVSVSPLSNVQLLRLVYGKSFWVSPAKTAHCKYRCRLSHYKQRYQGQVYLKAY